MSKQMIFGSAIKSVSPWDLDSNVGWTAYGNSGMDEIDLYFRRVPWFRRGVKDRSLNVSALPWSIMQGKNEIATSAEWSDNKPKALEWLDNPRKLFGQIEQSLAVTGLAYIALECNTYGYIKAAKYCSPNTITEIYDQVTGKLDHFERTVNGHKINCDPATAKFRAGVVRIVAIYDADYLTETGHPAVSSDGLAALSASGVLFSVDVFVEKFFSRGAIKASILSVEGGAQSEIDRLQSWWEDVISGVKNAWSAIIMRGKMAAPMVIGEGIDGLENDSLSTSKRQDIATALGVPESRMWSSAANYATRNADEKAYFRGTIIPEFDLIAEGFNSQIFIDIHDLAGYRIESQPETLDVFQEDEADRAGSLAQLTGAGVPLKLAMEILGYDLTDKQWLQLTPPPAEVPTLPAVIEQPALMAPEMATYDYTLTNEGVIKELEIWQRKAIKAFKSGVSANCEFTIKYIPDDTAEDIKLALEMCRSIEDIKAAFVQQQATTDPYIAIAERLTLALEKATA